MTRWFSLDLCSSAERREAGNISVGDQKGLQQQSARTHCMLKIWHTSSLHDSLSHTHTISPLLIKDANVLHTQRKTVLDRSSTVGCFARALDLPAKQWPTLQGKTELNCEGTEYSGVIHHCPSHLNSNTNEPHSQLSHFLLESQCIKSEPTHLQQALRMSDNLTWMSKNHFQHQLSI